MGLPPLTTVEAFAAEVRDYIRDWPELNRLISGEESSDRFIGYCIWLSLDEWNTTPPLSSHSLADFPSRTILLHLTIIHLLTSVGILKARNRFRYNDGGFSVETESQVDEYQRWIQLLRGTSQASDQKIQSLKRALNIEGGWGAGIGSEYGWIHGWYGVS